MKNIPEWAREVFETLRKGGHPDFPDFEDRIKGRWSEINSDVLPELERLKINQKSELLQSLLTNGFHFRGERASEARYQLKNLIKINKDIAKQAEKLASQLRQKQGILDQGLVYDCSYLDERLWNAKIFVPGNPRFHDLHALEDILEGLARSLGYPVREEVSREEREEKQEAVKYKTLIENVWEALPANEKRKWQSLKRNAEKKGEVIYEHEIIAWAALPEYRKRKWEAFTENDRAAWEIKTEEGKIEFEELTKDNKWIAESAAYEAELEARRKFAANYLEKGARIIGHRHNHIALASRQASPSDYIRIVLEALTVWDEEKAGREEAYFNLSNRAVATLAGVLFDLPPGSVTEENVRKTRRLFKPLSYA